ncbi:MAG: glutathione S-transferase N-terminal domain-containing protein [Candidatus Wildermuthbacteria bacterium]|nr:glutathione S-transferase N-terminal domain-containing protein [Candidatus Wildermuthbacteria bacterium]
MDTLVLYTAPGFKECDKVRDYLRHLHVEFEEKDVSEDKAAFEEMARVSWQMGVPVLRRGKDFVFGSDVVALEAFLLRCFSNR